MISEWIRNLTMSRRISLAFLGVLIGSLILISVSVSLIGGQALNQAYQAQLDSTALEKQANLSEWFNRAGHDLQVIARNPVFEKNLRPDVGQITLAERADILKELSIWTGNNNTFLELYIVDWQSHTILFSGDPALEGQLFHRETITWPTSGVTLSQVFFEGSPAKPVMYAVTTIAGFAGSTPIYLVGRLNMDQVTAVVSRRIGSDRTDESLLVTADQRLIVVPRQAGGQYAPGQTIDSLALQACVKGNDGTIITGDYRNIPSVINYRWLPGSQMCLVVKMDQAEIYAPTNALMQTMAGVAAFSLLLSLTLAVFISRRLARPLSELLYGVEAFGHGQLDLRLPVTTSEEIGRLRAAFNQMADNLQETLSNLSESEERYRRLSESTFEGLVFSENGLILDVNPQFAWMFGFRHDELIGRPVLDLIAPGSRETVLTYQQIGYDRPIEFSAMRQNETTFAAEANGHLTPYKGRWVQLTAVRDLSAQKEAQAAQSRLLSILEATPDYVSTAAPDGQFLYLNRAARQMLEIPKEENILNMTLREVHPEWANRIVLDQGIPTAIKNGSWAGESAILSRSGREIPVSKVIIAHHSPEGELEYISAINRDISTQKQMENELRAARDELEQRVEERTREVDTKAKELTRSNAELEQFAYVASHDLQEPLRMISSYLQLLERRYKGQLDSDADDYIHFAVDGAQRLKRLINDLLAYSRVGTHGQAFEEVDTNQLVSQLHQNLKVAIQEAEGEITAGSLPVIYGDPVQLEQLFQNLVMNALKFRGEQPSKVDISAEQVNNEWVFSVHDNGIGIDPEYAERIFVIFQRLHSRERYPGTGIGLAVCKRIVERHGGRIWVESQPGQGTTFFFTLPAK